MEIEVGAEAKDKRLSRRAACQCGQLTAVCVGEPVRVSVCHCLDCQRRSGSAFAAQARYAADAVTIAGRSHEWVRTTESGAQSFHHFCPECGSTLWYHARPFHDLFAIPLGAFADPSFPPPIYSVYEGRKHGWVAIQGDGIEHFA